MHWSEFADTIEIAREMTASDTEEELKLGDEEAAELFAEGGIYAATELHLYLLLLAVRKIKNRVSAFTDDTLRGTAFEGYIIWLSEAQGLVRDVEIAVTYSLYSRLPESVKLGEYRTVDGNARKHRKNVLIWAPFVGILSETAQLLSFTARLSPAMLALEDRMAAEQRDEMAAMESGWRQELCMCYIMGARAAAGTIVNEDAASEQARMFVYQVTIMSLIWLLPYLPLEVTGWQAP